MPAIHALFPGTFDPITLGHLDLVRRASALFERVTVLVAAHATKGHVFDLEQRVALVRGALDPVDGFAGVSVATTAGLLVDALEEYDAQAVVRGVRGAVDVEYELSMANTNRAMRPRMDTVLLAATPEFAHVSSTLVRQIASLGGDVSTFVPPNVLAALRERFPQPRS